MLIYKKETYDTNTIFTGYASDGENLMQESGNSLMTKIRTENPNLYVLKCYCHTIHLVACQACSPLSATAEQLIHDIYNYFKMSPNRKSSLEEIQLFWNCEPHKMLKPSQTRWLLLRQCIKRVREQWLPLLNFFLAEIIIKNKFIMLCFFFKLCKFDIPSW